MLVKIIPVSSVSVYSHLWKNYIHYLRHTYAIIFVYLAISTKLWSLLWCMHKHTEAIGTTLWSLLWSMHNIALHRGWLIEIFDHYCHVCIFRNTHWCCGLQLYMLEFIHPWYLNFLALNSNRLVEKNSQNNADYLDHLTVNIRFCSIHGFEQDLCNSIDRIIAILQ